MAKPIVIYWPIPDQEAICLLQSRTGAGNLLINGNLTINTFAPGEAIFDKITRTVSLTSTNNLSAVNFTITGMLNGSQISEVIAGPNANTVETTSIFDSVSSVSVSGSVTNVSIGSGTTGRSKFINYNYNVIYNFVNFQISQLQGTINWSVKCTLDNVQNVPNPFYTTLAGPASTDFFLEGAFISYAYAGFFVNSSGADGQLQFTYVEQGII